MKIFIYTFCFITLSSVDECARFSNPLTEESEYYKWIEGVWKIPPRMSLMIGVNHPAYIEVKYIENDKMYHVTSKEIGTGNKNIPVIFKVKSMEHKSKHYIAISVFNKKEDKWLIGFVNRNREDKSKAYFWEFYPSDNIKYVEDYPSQILEDFLKYNADDLTLFEKHTFEKVF